MTSLGLDLIFTEHTPSPSHPESPERVQAIHDKLQAEGLITECSAIPISEVSDDNLLAVHSQAYLDRAADACLNGASFLDSPDVEISEHSFSLAKKVAGTACNAIDSILDGSAKNAFLATRPP